MRGLWKSLTWVLLLITTTVEPIRAQSLKRKLGSNKWDRIHEAIQGQKRAASECPTDYQLCPQSLNGGCCPSDRSCGSSSCYPTTTTTATACGISGYIGCGIDEGGGCCPSSYSCYKNGCSPLPGVTYSETCGANSYLCPASLNYGCCKFGLACGLDNCYSTDITTFTLIETFTTTSSSETYTFTSTIVTAAGPQAPTVTATSSYAPSVLPKVGVSATPIPKTAASSTPTNGLTTPEIGGIIGGAIALLLVVLIATCIILRRLNIAIKKSESAKSKRSKSSTGQSHTRQTKKSHTKKSRDTIDFDTMSNDPFLMSPSEDGDPRSKRRVSHPPTVYSPELDSTEISPPYISPFSPRSPPSSHNRSPRGYQAIPNSDSRNSGQGYFDIPPHEDLRDQNLRFGRRPSQHSRNYSDASDQSQQQRRPSQHTRNLSEVSEQSQRSRGSSTLAELDAGPDGDRRRSFQSALQSFGMNVFRRQSEPPGTVALTYREEPLDYIDEQREPLGRFEDVPLTEMSNAQLRHGSVHGAGVSFSQLPGFPEAGPSREQREDT